MQILWINAQISNCSRSFLNHPFCGLAPAPYHPLRTRNTMHCNNCAGDTLRVEVEKELQWSRSKNEVKPEGKRWNIGIKATCFLHCPSWQCPPPLSDFWFKYFFFIFTSKLPGSFFDGITVKPRYTGLKSNGNPPITNTKLWSFPVIFFFHFLYWQ